MSWSPITGSTRAAGGLLAVVAAEKCHETADQQRRGPAGPVATAMVDLARAYVAAGVGAPDLNAVAERHEGIAGCAWLVPVALARPESSELVSDALELAARTGVPMRELRAALAYVELAAMIRTGRPVDLAVQRATGRPVPEALPTDSGHVTTDCLAYGLWGLGQRRPLGELLPELADATSPPVAAAVGGLVGLRDGFGPTITGFDAGPECLSLAGRLQRTRRRNAFVHSGHLDPR